MKRRVKQIVTALAGAVAIGTLHQTGCAGFAGDQFLRTTDFCFLFDCQNGAFAGLFDPCPEILADPDADEEGNLSLFVDCPVNVGN